MTFASDARATSAIRATGLRCEYVSNPIGLDEMRSRFSWVVDHPERGQRQTAYQILVASSLQKLSRNEGEMWDSGKVESSESTNIVYSGRPLESRQVYYWAVRLWDKEGRPGPYSGAATFEMGLLQEEEWGASWITAPETISGAPLLRKEFVVHGFPERARVYIAGLGYYELRLNGQKVGDRVLDPAQTDYDKLVLYATYDVTRMIQPGRNGIGVILGNGRYSPPDVVVERNPGDLRKYGRTPVLILQLYLLFSDGTSMTITTDETWRAALGPIVFNDIYDGEVYDARLERPGWDMPGYDDSEWQPAVRASDPPKGKLVSSAAYPPIKITKTLPAREITSPRPGVYVVDFGQNLTGWVRLRASGPRGAEVRVRYAEILNPDGTLNTAPNRSAKATDVYILKGEGEEVYEPRFTYHGFRYAEITGLAGVLTTWSVEARVVHSAVSEAGGFHCSNPLINRIHELVRWGQVSNLMSVPTDCPQRDERMGWMGDAQLTAEEAIHNFDMAGFYTKWIDDIKHAQGKDGSVPSVVPPYWSKFPADPAWGTACVTIPWYVYLYYGDRRILERSYAVMQKWVAFLEKSSKEHIVGGQYGDWCPPGHVRSVDTPVELVGTYYYYHDTLRLSQIARVLGRESDAKMYAEKAEQIKEAFNKAFLREGRYVSLGEQWYLRLIPETAPEDEKRRQAEEMAKVFGVYSQTANVFALSLGLVPDQHRQNVVDTLVHDITVIHGHHLNTGIVGTRYLPDVLTEHGHAELAYRLVTQTTYPSWGYMIKEGATTLWERWEYLDNVGMNSHNHIMLGSIDAWFYRVIAGIRLAAPGWQKVHIKPTPLGDLKHAGASVHTVRGLVASKWVRRDREFVLQAAIPTNVEAEVWVPKLGMRQVVVREGGAIVWEKGQLASGAVPGIVSGREERDHVVFEVGSGQYEFVLTGE